MSPAPRILARHGRAALASRGATLALALGLFTACSSGEDPAGPGLEEVQASQRRWAAGAPEDYGYVVQRLCECLPAVTRPVLVEVRGGAVASRTYAGTAEEVPAELARFYPTVEGLFALAAEALASGAASVELTVHPDLGHPIRLYIDYDAATADEELLLLASELSPR